MRIRSKVVTIIMISLLVTLSLLVTCDSSDDKEEITPAQTATVQPTEVPVEDVTITVGVLSDMTGPAAKAMEIVNQVTNDLIEYFNEEDLIPGVKLDAIFYDGGFDPSKDIPGYEWLKEKGADVFLATPPHSPATLKARVDKEKVVLFAMTVGEEILDPSGYVFCMNNSAQTIIKTLLAWVAENDWDWQTKGPAKVGATSWSTSYFVDQHAAAEEYAKAHPDQFEWVGSWLTAFSSFDFASEANALKDVDYVLPPGAPWAKFTREYKIAGGKGKQLLTDAQASFIGFTSASAGWDAIDGSLVTLSCRWWNEDAELSDLANKLVRENHDDADDIIFSGMAYISSIHHIYGIINSIKQTVENVGPQNFSQEALYNTLLSFPMDYGEAYEEWSFDENTRHGWDHMAVFRIDGTEEDLIRLEPDWYPVVRTK
jgi:ABC-type branched-subunit amino acid transport system substrate-binding protein